MNSNSRIKILFLAADPSDVTRLRLMQELREIREKLQPSKGRENFLLESRESVRPGDISQAFFDVEPQIVHFSGHGAPSGELYFENEIGKAHPVQPSALASLFRLHSNRVRCVVLNACYSHIQAEAIAEHISFVIGMNKAIGDKAAIIFAAGFYKALGANCSIEQAYEHGKVDIQLYGIPEHLTPVFISRKNTKDSAIEPNFQEEISISEKYRKLEELLIAASAGDKTKWKAADEETLAVMLKVARRTKEGWLTHESLQKFPCKDLRVINSLWSTHTNNRFGFGIQQKIYAHYGGGIDGQYNEDAWQKFSLAVGWRTRKGWLLRPDVVYDISAPPGHLPTGIGLGAQGAQGWWRRLVILASRTKCKL